MKIREEVNRNVVLQIRTFCFSNECSLHINRKLVSINQYGTHHRKKHQIFFLFNILSLIYEENFLSCMKILKLITVYLKKCCGMHCILHIKHIVFCPSVSISFVKNYPMILIFELARMIQIDSMYNIWPHSAAELVV